MVREGYSDILTITRVIRAGHKKSWVGGRGWGWDRTYKGSINQNHDVASRLHRKASSKTH